MPQPSQSAGGVARVGLGDPSVGLTRVTDRGRRAYCLCDRATIHVKSLSSLAVSPTIGGPDASWMVRWTMVTPGQTGNGDIFYAGMDNNAGAGGSGTPTFFDGNTASVPPPNPEEHAKYLTYPQTNVLSSSTASYNAKTGVSTMHIPLADVGSSPAGTVLYSVTAFSATAPTPQSSTTLFNLTDATTPFDLTVIPSKK